MSVIGKYEKEIKELKDFLLSLKNFNPDSITIYGSSINEKTFDVSNSDIDVIAMSSNFNEIDKKELLNELNDLKLDFFVKRPTVVKDALCERIEFYNCFENVNVDLTLCSPLIPSVESLKLDAWYDGFEALMGGVYLHSKTIYGEIPDYKLFLDSFYPFYNDEIRDARLATIYKRLKNYNQRIYGYYKENNIELIEHLIKCRKYFIKFLFIYYRTYYWTPEKHINYQLTNFLNLPEEIVNKLNFANGDFRKMTMDYLDVSEDYLNKYVMERKLWEK